MRRFVGEVGRQGRFEACDSKSEAFGVGDGASGDAYSAYCGDGSGDAVLNEAPPAAPADAQPLRAAGDTTPVQQRVVPGMGYNLLTAEYFNPGSVKKSPILDLAKLNSAGLLQEDSDNKTVTDMVAGSSLSEYQKDYSTSMSVSGGAGLFKASVSSNFGSSTSYGSNSVFVTYRANIRKKQYFLGDADPDTLRESYLSASFRKAVDNPKTTPAALFNTYGTHLLAQMGVGGRLDMNYRFDSSSYETKSSLETMASAAYGAISASGSYKSSSAAKRLEDSRSLRVSSVGGTTDITPTTELSALHDSYANWIRSVNVSDATSLSFIGPPSKDAPLSEWTVPVWELASSPARQRDICVEFHKQLDANATGIAGLQPTTYVSDLFLAFSGYSADTESALFAQFPVTATKRNWVTWDVLNLTAYGPGYSYLGWAFGTDPNRAITDVYIGSEDSYTNKGVTYDIVPGADKKPLRMCGKAIFYTRDARAAQGDGFKLTGMRIYNGYGQVGGDAWTTDNEWKLLTPGGINNVRGYGCSYQSDGKKVYVQGRFTKPRA